MEENIQNQPQSQQPQQPQQPRQPQGQKKNTGMAILAYIIFFIPLLTDSRKDPFVKYHVKQGLLLFIGWIAVAIIGAILAMVSWRLWIIVRLLNAVIFVLMILGIISASQGHQKPLPLIGKFGEMFKF